MKHGTYHLADNPTLYEPSRSNNFEFIVTGIDSLLKPGVEESTANENDYIKNGQEILRISVASETVPHFDLSTIELKRGNSVMKFAGTPSFGNQTLVLNDFMGARTKDVLLAWQALAYDVNNEKVKSATKYKKDCMLVEYSPDYEEILRTWTLKGCWISNVDEPAFDNDSNEKRRLTATVVYDSYRISD